MVSDLINMVSSRVLPTCESHCIYHGLGVKDAFQKSVVNTCNMITMFWQRKGSGSKLNRVNWPVGHPVVRKLSAVKCRQLARLLSMHGSVKALKAMREFSRQRRSSHVAIDLLCRQVLQWQRAAGSERVDVGMQDVMVPAPQSLQLKERAVCWCWATWLPLLGGGVSRNQSVHGSHGGEPHWLYGELPAEQCHWGPRKGLSYLAVWRKPK